MGGSSSKVGTDASVPVPNKIREVVPGVTIETIQAGNGELPRDGQNVAVHYTGTLENGTKFDSSRDRAQPFVFAVGGGQVIRCWDKAVAEMSIGERANVRCSPEVCLWR